LSPSLAGGEEHFRSTSSSLKLTSQLDGGDDVYLSCLASVATTSSSSAYLKLVDT